MADLSVGPPGRQQHVLEWEESRPAEPTRTTSQSPLILLHASGCHAGWWEDVAPELARRLTRRVLAPDLRGHGDSDPSEDGAYGWGVFLRDLDELMYELELESPILIGHSMGGFIALLYAGRGQVGSGGGVAGDVARQVVGAGGPTVAGVVAADLLCEVGGETLERLHLASERPAPVFDSKEAAVAAFRLVPAGTSAPPEVLYRLAEGAVRQTSDGAWTYKFDRRSLRLEPAALWDAAPVVKCPVMVVRGEYSPLMAADTAQRLADALPNGRTREVAGAFHNLMLDQPQLFVDAVVQFVAGTQDAGRPVV